MGRRAEDGQMGRRAARDAVRHVLCGDPSGDEALKEALAAIGYTENAPVLRTGHQVWDAATSPASGKSASAVFVPVVLAVDTRQLSSMSCMDQSLFKAFHTELCE